MSIFCTLIFRILLIFISYLIEITIGSLKMESGVMASKPIIIRSEGLFPSSRRIDPSLVKLATAILIQAIRDFLSPQLKLESDWKEWQADAGDWFDSDSFDPGSFHWICQIIGLSPETVREWVFDLEKLDRKAQQNALLSLLRMTQLRRRNSEPEEVAS